MIVVIVCVRVRVRVYSDICTKDASCIDHALRFPVSAILGILDSLHKSTDGVSRWQKLLAECH